jgi:hypothetical protein
MGRLKKEVFDRGHRELELREEEALRWIEKGEEKIWSSEKGSTVDA